MLSFFRKFFSSDETEDRSLNQIDKELLIQVISDYKKDCFILMSELAKRNNLDISNKEDFRILISPINTQIPRKGILSKKWNYAFHGGDCGFNNVKTRLKVEVKLDDFEISDKIDVWFLLTYIQSSSFYKENLKYLDYLTLKNFLD